MQKYGSTQTKIEKRRKKNQESKHLNFGLFNKMYLS